jgi:hypothetical protein
MALPFLLGILPLIIPVHIVRDYLATINILGFHDFKYFINFTPKVNEDHSLHLSYRVSHRQN